MLALVFTVGIKIVVTRLGIRLAVSLAPTVSGDGWASKGQERTGSEEDYFMFKDGGMMTEGCPGHGARTDQQHRVKCPSLQKSLCSISGRC